LVNLAGIGFARPVGPGAFQQGLPMRRPPGSRPTGGSAYPRRINPRTGGLEELRPSNQGAGPNRWQAVQEAPTSPAHAPVGRPGSYLNTEGANARTVIDGREYSGHALDRMQEQGLTPSIVENAIRYGITGAGRSAGTTVYVDRINRISVVLDNESGRVVTVDWGQFAVRLEVNNVRIRSAPIPPDD
jgi:hypothetical protein